MPKTFLNLPHGLEVLIIKAAVDPDFKTLLLERRAEAAGEIGLTLTPAEAAMLAAIPAATLEATIAQTQVLPETRRVFLGKVAAAMLAALGVTGGPALQPWAMAPMGIFPDMPPGRDAASTSSVSNRQDPAPQPANTATSQTLHTRPAPTPPRAVIESIFFDRGQATIRADQRPQMKRNLEIMKKTLTDGQRILVSGRSDASGTPEANLALCERRAAAVRDALIKGGLPAGRIKTQALPARATERKPPADPQQLETEAARERRVDILILGEGESENKVKAGNAETSATEEMIDLRERVTFPKPMFSAGNRPYIPPDALRDGWDVSPNSKRQD